MTTTQNPIGDQMLSVTPYFYYLFILSSLVSFLYILFE